MGKLDGDGEVQMPSIVLWWGPGRRTSASQKNLAGALIGILSSRGKVHFDGCVAEPLQIITAILPGSKWSCILLRIVWQKRTCGVTNFTR